MSKSVKILPVVSTLFLLSGFPGVLAGEERVSFEQVLKLTAADTAGGDEFGTSVAMSGERLIVGAQWDDDRGSASGSAYIFERSPGGDPGDWTEVAKLVAPDGVASDWFGNSVGLSGDRAVVGAFHQATGYAYVFERDGSGEWVAVKKLLAGDFEPLDAFGLRVAISGETAVVAAGAAHGPGGDFDWGVGAVYVYERDAGGPANWGQVAKLTPALACDSGDPGRDGTACGWIGDEFFGSAVALRENTLLVGGEKWFYVLRRVGDGPDSWWQRVNRVSLSEVTAGDGFGSALAMSGGTVWAGAWGDDDLGSQAGAAYVFDLDPGVGLRQTAKLYAPDGEGGIYFGHDVAMSGETVVVGSPDIGGSFRGQAYVFRRREGSAGGWQALARLEPPDLEHSDNFSTNAVAIRGGTIAIGAHGDDDLGTNAGAVYIYEELQVDPALALSGSCPGEVVLAASGLTPKGEAAVYGSAAEGPFALPDGFCAGTELGLVEAELLVAELVVGEAGNLRTTPVLAEAACGSYLQILDLTSCALSNVAPVP